MTGDEQRRVPFWQQALVIVAILGVSYLRPVVASLDEQPGALHLQQLRQQTVVCAAWAALGVLFFLGAGLDFVTPLRPLFGRLLCRREACFLICTAAGLLVAVWFGWPVRDLPPLYHDEYSYLFQAATFLSGRVCFPAHALARCFDQLHVLNDGVYVSRYFPGTGLWLSPFLAVGMPVLGWWLCHGLVAGFVALAGCRHSAIVGYVAGLTTALSPGLTALSSRILSPHPTMLAVVFFLWTYSGIFENRSRLWPILAGASIGYAFVTRPLTAVGLAAPFALYSIYRLLRTPPPQYHGRFLLLISSFAVWVTALAAYNTAITGRPWRSPYGIYMESVTPSHDYGFYNVERGSAKRGPTTFTAYDVWALNLTPRDAVRQAAFRWWRLCGLACGLAPVVGLTLLVVLQLPVLGDRVVLLLLTAFGISAAYFPYWFSGVLGCSYIIEAIPCVLLLVGIALGRLVADAFARNRPFLAAWWLLLPTSIAVVNLQWTTPGYFAASSDLVYPRILSDRLRREEEQLARSGPILVIVDADPRDAIHTTLVHNTPSLDGPIVRAWDRGEDTQRLLDAYPDRSVWKYRNEGMDKPGRWQRLRMPIAN